ncbi:Microtubule-actin cross-linking factor 1 [Collichthys lucidus]|uniref:Microtubule-actin cross-linking factor 1 n=1 Tax=Collichthys lucidus TaxID=240159 RepID=A0A4U5VKX6_COLLU|nr:Microtubule-actin cross-linking factor 1 [Collichthys lucidus]
MGNSMGCVRPTQEGELSGAPPLSPKKRLRFRRKHKGKKNRKGELEHEDFERQRSNEPDEREEEDEDDEEKAAITETADSDFSSRARTLIPVPDTQLIHSKTNLHSNTLSPGSLSTNVGGLLGSRILEASPKPSPAWRGVFCLPGEEDTVSAIIDVSSIPSQTTTTTPVNTAPVLGSTTPGGGRVCRVREKVQGVLEKPWILKKDKQKDKKDKGRVEREEKGDVEVKGGPEGTIGVVRTPSGRERKGVVHIREVDGKLCVVRTVYPSDFGSPVWRGDSDSEVDVYKELPASSPVTGNILKVQLSEDDERRAEMSGAGGFPRSSNQMRIQEAMIVKGFSLDTPDRAPKQPSLLESGYASDLPLTSPETAGTTPSQTDWGGLTSSSSERLDSMIESPMSLQQHATVKYLPQISEIYVSGESGDLTAKEKLLLWSQQATEGYPGLRCVNFTSSWSDGRMFNALLHRYRPDLIDMEVVSQQSNRENLEQAFEIAESLGVTRLLDAEDVDVPSPDEKSVITYVSSIYDAFPKIPEGGEGISANEVDQRCGAASIRPSWPTRTFPQNPVELKALYNEYVHFKETEIPAKENEKGHIEHLYKLLEDMSRVESGEAVQCERELACYLQDCESLIRQLNQELKVLRDEKYYQVEQLAFRVSCLQEELVSLRLQCSSVYRKGHFSQALGSTGPEHTSHRGTDSGLTLGQTLLGAVGAVGAVGAALLRRPMARSQLVAMSSSEDEGSLRFIYELLGWVEETQDLLERAEWGADLPSVENNLQEHNTIHTAVEELMSSLQEARSYEEHSSWRLRSLESLHAFVSHCTEELIWLNEREEEEIAFDWSDNNPNMNAKRELHSEMRLELDEKQEVMHSLQETANRLCQENHPAKQTVEAYSAALQTQWQWVKQLCVCVEQHLKDNTAYFQFTSDARDCESYLRQLQETIKRQYTCDKNSRLSKLEDLLQDSMEEKEQLIEYRSTVASLVGRAKTVVQLRPRSAESTLGTTTPIKAICDYRQIEITISRGEECVLEDNSQRTKWKVISPTGNEAMVPSVCFTVPPPNQEAIDTASRAEQLYQKVMSLWHQLHINMKSVVSWHYLLKDIRGVSGWNLDTVRCQSPAERQQVLDHLESQLADFLSDSKESALFTPGERRELEKDVQQAQQHCQDLLLNMETVEKDESVSRSYLSELQNITLRLNDAEQRLMRGIETPPPSRQSGDSANKLSRLQSKRLKTVDVLIRSLEDAESQVRKNESRLSEEDIVPADTTAIQNLRDQLEKWQAELADQDEVFQSLQSEVRRAKEAGSQLSRLHPDRSPELERYQEKANQMVERWNGIKRQMETRRSDLDALGSALQQYRDGHSALIKWIEETTERQENTQPGQTDSKALSEQLAQQTALVVEIERNQTKLDECQTHSKQYCISVKDYELQLMTYRAFVESTQKSPVKRRRMHSSSDAITQEFMDLRTRYTALVTLTTQHVKYISDALRRLEEEEKEVEEEKQARVGQVSDLLGWVKGLQGRTGGPNAESSLAAQQAISEQLAAKKDEVAEAIRSTQVFLLSKQASKLSPEERGNVEAQLDELTATYSQLCDSSTQQLQQLEHQLAKEEERKNHIAIAGVIDLGTVETFPVFKAAQRGLIDQDTCRVLLEAQLIMGGLLQPDSPLNLSLEQGLAQGLIDTHTRQALAELESALLLVENSTNDQQQNVLPVATAMQLSLIREEVGLRVLELQMNTGGLRDSTGKIMSMEEADNKRLLTPRTLTKLQSRLQHRELIDPNTAEKLNLHELQRRCVLDNDSGLLLLPVKQQPGGTVCLRSGRKVGIFRAVQEGLIDRKVTVRLLEAQLFAGGIADPRSGHRLTVDEAVRHGLMDQDLACAMLARQLQNGGILDPFSGERLDLEESIRRDLLPSRLAVLVLESLWAFMGILWPESGELLPIVEALQQGIISGELSRNILRQRHAIGALYNPETLQVLPLNEDAEEALEPCVVSFLKDIHIPDVLSSMNQSGTPSLNRLSWGSTSSSPPPSSPPPSSSPEALVWDATPTHGMDPEEQAKHKLLFHLMTHSYVDAHSGKRLVLLDPELVELVKATLLVAGDSVEGSKVEPQSCLTTDEQEELEMGRQSSLTDEVEDEEGLNVVTPSKKFERNGTGSLQVENVNKLLPEPAVTVESEKLKVKAQKKERSSLESAEASAKNLEGERTLVLTKEPDELVVTESKPKDSGVQESRNTIVTAPLKSEGYFGLLKEPTPLEAKTKEDNSTQCDDKKDEKYSHTESEEVSMTETDSKHVKPQVNIPDSAVEQEEEAAELASLVLELKQGGLMTEEGEKLLPDEAVAQGVLPGHTAVKLMAQASLFGGFLDANSGESLSMEDVMQEGLLDEDLMWSVLKSDKTLAGVVDAEKRQICGVKEAAQAGLIDSNTAARLLEAQVVSGGIVDLRRDKKVSVTLAANLGLIEQDQREEFVALEKAYKGKDTDPSTSFTKASLQLQMEGVVDPESKSPLPLEQAIQKGLIRSDEAYQVLARQVAEGGIIHHASGMRLSVSDAVDRGLVDRSIAPGLEELEWVYQGKSLVSMDATAKGLISSDIASEIQEKLASVAMEDDEVSVTPVASSNGTYSPPAIIMSVCSSDSPANWSDVSTEVSSGSPLSNKDLAITHGSGKTMTSVDDQSLLYGTAAEEDKVELPVSVEEKALIEPDQSMDLLSKFATNVEKRIQQAIEEIIPQTEPLPLQEPDERLQTSEGETDDKQQGDVFRDFVGESIQTNVDDTDKDSQEEKGAATLKSDREATEAVVDTDELESQDKCVISQIYSQKVSTAPPNGESEAKVEEIGAENNLVKQGQEAVQTAVEVTEHTTEPEKDAIEITLLKGTGKIEEMKQKEQKEKDEEKASVSQQPEQPESSQEEKKRKQQEMPQKSPLPDDEKAALILKAKESILKKVFEKGVSKKQTAEELQALRNEVGKKESQGATVKEAKAQTLPAKLDKVKGHEVKETRDKRTDSSPKEREEEKSVREDKLPRVEEDTTVEKLSVSENRETKLLEDFCKRECWKGRTYKKTLRRLDRFSLKRLSKVNEINHAGKGKKKKRRQTPKANGSNDQPRLESSESAEDASTESESPGVPESDTATESWEEGDDGVRESQEIVSNKEPAKTSKSSLRRQECLEHDQQIVALVSIVRHIEVRLKQQQQQSVGRSLIALDDIIRQTEALDLELHDLEPAISKEVEAAEQLLKPQPKDVPPQLLLALEKDGRSLARGYEAARTLSEDILQSLRAHRDSYKELQSSLMARTNEVNGVAFDIQVFISERAQDLAPEQSRQLLGQLQQLQRAFHQTSGQAQAWADALSAQREREEERQRRERVKDEQKERERQRAREREVVQQQKAECSQKLEGLSMWLAGAASLLASQKAGAESDDVNVLQEKQKKLKEVQKDLQTKQEGIAEAIRSVEELLAERRESLSPEERENLQAKAEEDLQETKGQIDSLLKELSSLSPPGGRGAASVVKDVADSPFSQPEGAVVSHTEMLQAELQQLQAQQAQLLQITQATRSLLEQPDSTVPPEEKQRLRAALDQLQAQHQDKLQSCQDRLRKSESLKDELTKFLQEHGSLGAWLEQSEQELRSLGEGETDAQGLKGRLEEHRKLGEDVICHKADLRFVSISGQKVLDSVQGALEQVGGSDPAMESTKQLVTDKLQDANHRYTTLHTKSTELGSRLSGLLERYQQYQDEVVSLHSWLSTQEQNQSIAKPTGETDPQNLQNTLRQVQLLQDELAERSVQLEKVKRAGRDLVSTDESPSLKAVDILCAADGLEKRFGSLSASVSERAEQLQTAVAQSVSVQEGLNGLLSWLDKLVLNPVPVEPTAQAVQDSLTQNQSRLKALSLAGQPDRGVDDYRQTIEVRPGVQFLLNNLQYDFKEVRSELEQEAGQLKSFCNLGTELSQSKAFSNTQSLLDNVKGVSDEFTQLEANVNERFAAIQACEQQLLQFRGLSGSLVRWLQTAQDQLPSKEANLNTEGLQRRVQQLTDLLNDWESQQSRVQELNKTGSELESLIIDITAPQTKTGAPQINGSSGPSSVNGIHTCKDLTELQVAVSDVNTRYEALGGELKDRLARQQASLELRQKAKQGTEELKSWLTDREHSLKQGQTASPSRPEVVRAQAQENKALLSELAEHSGKVEELKSSLRKLITDNPDSPEADSWRQQLQEIDSRWQTANQTAAQRQTELETCADRLGSFASAANQLGPWLREKELMMSVLGPLSIDPNMLNTQKQQVQFMLREFETRRPQFDQLTQSAEGILSQTGDSAQDPKDLAEVRAELGSISQQWEDLTNRLSQRSNHIDQAQGTSERYQALLRELSSSVSALSERLDAQASLSAQPEALKRRLQETGEIRSELERRRTELAEAEKLCQELSAIVAEPYLKEELSKRLESVSGPLKSLEERAADGLSQLQTALSSTQQFQQMFEELRSWLDKQADPRDPSTDSLPCQPKAIRSLLAQTAELQRGIASQRGSYELIQAEGVTLLATLPAGGDERSALQSRLASLRQDWEGLNQRVSDRENRLKTTLSKADTYQQHKAELTPWVAECEQRDGEIHPSLDPSALEEALQKARGLSLDLERRQPLLEAFNSAADQLLEQCCIGEEEVRDEKAQLNRRVDKLGERLHNHTSQLEELAGRLKEFEEGRQAAERRLEAAKHQIEVQEALGAQACSAKSLERLRSQQESLRSLNPQVVYLRDLAQGLVQDSPQTPGGSTEGAQRLQEQARETEKQYDDVTEKIEQCCSSLESRLQGVGEVQSHVRDVFSRLADLDDELDSLSPVGRDADSLASQADALKGFLSRLANLRSELEGHASECTTMLRREGSSPDLLALRRETEALSRQAGKLSERGQARLDQIEDAAEKVRDFYRLVSELQGLLGRAEEGLTAQGMVGTEVETIKQQLQEFKISTALPDCFKQTELLKKEGRGENDEEEEEEEDRQNWL